MGQHRNMDTLTTAYPALVSPHPAINSQEIEPPSAIQREELDQRPPASS